MDNNYYKAYFELERTHWWFLARNEIIRSQVEELFQAKGGPLKIINVGVATGAYAYTSSEQSRADLYIFGVKPYADCIASTLSMNNVLPRGTYVKFDTDSYLEENYAADSRPDTEIQENTQEALA